MLSIERVQRTGITYDGPDAGDRDSWHTVADMNYPTDTDDALHMFDTWRVVAYVPRFLTYYDDDAEAMDETNYDALVSDVVCAARGDDDDEYAVSVFSRGSFVSGHWTDTWTGLDDAARLGVAELDMGYPWGHALLIAPDRTDALDAAADARSALFDYPLLDESAYSEREYAAWTDYVSDGLRYDTVRDMRETGTDDETVDALDDAWDDVAAAACERLHYWSGWTGEHGPDMSVCVAAALVDGLVSTFYGSRPAYVFAS